MNALDRYFGIHASALQLRSKRVELIASNIANAATPNYKARDIDFEAALSSASGDGAMRATSAMHLQPAGGGAGGDPLYRMPMQTSLDGNTVELASEQTEFAENAVRYQTTLSFLNGRISTLMSAIKGQ